jgi:peroxiredoxin
VAAEQVEVQVGQVAPDFKLPSHDGKIVQLSELRGRPVVIGTFALAFTSG